MTDAFQTVCAALYLGALLFLMVYGMNCYCLMFFFCMNRRGALKKHAEVRKNFHDNHAPENWPHVTIQLPIFNERYVVRRLIRSICLMDYPRELLQIQVLDDSTDDTAHIAETVTEQMRRQGFDMEYVHRSDRTGFKAGALKEGLRTAKGDLVGIFDADFVPDRNFLKETVPHFADPGIGMLQTRWGHINGDYSLLTRAQSIGIDGHFGVEQAARAWSGFFLNFNGTAGIWRKKAIEDSGGWQTDTLTEDLDLSYRAQLNGWKLQFVTDVVCRAELPVTITAFKSQQHRWAKGSIQTARKNLGRLFRSDVSLLVKIQAFLHLTHYIVHSMMILMVLTSIPMLHSGWLFHTFSWPIMIFTMLSLATFGPSSMYCFSQKILYHDWKRRICFLPFLMCIGTGIAVNNTRAVLEAFFNIESGFVRTPKYGISRPEDAWHGKSYTVPPGAMMLLDLFLGIYSLAGLLMFLFLQEYLVSPFMLIYSTGFFYVFFLSLKQEYGKTRP